MESESTPTGLPHSIGREITVQLGSNSARSDGAQAASPTAGVPDHELLRCIGRGSYGEVWLAQNIMGTYRAVKVVYRHSFDHERPFEREFEGIRRFEPVSRTHESQLNLLHMGKGNGYFYYVMELADDQGHGQQIDPGSYTPRTLRSELHLHGRLPFDQCLRIALGLTTALEHLHLHGLVHRDIKPSNVIFVNGIPKLADIGLVALADATLSFVGTEGYVPPEGPGSPQADIFSLGKLLYEISTGRDRQDYPELPTNLRELPDREGILELNEVIIKACQPVATKRYVAAGEMHDDLVLLQSGKSLARLRTIERRLTKWKQAGLIGAAVTTLVAVGLVWQVHQARRMRNLAKENIELARVSQQKADESRQRLARTQVVNGARLMDQGDLLGSLVWFCEAAALEQGEPQREAIDLFRIHSVLRDCPKLEQIFFHEGGIDFTTFSDDGKLLVTASEDHTARVWDVTTGQPVTAPLQHQAAVDSASLSSDGHYLATASKEAMAQVWEVRTGRLAYTLPHEAKVFYVSFSRDGRLLFTVSTDGSRCWDVATRKLLYPVVKDEGRTAGLSPDGAHFATGYHTLRVREAATGSLVFETPAKNPRINQVAFSPDSQRIITGSADGTAQVWDLTRRKPIGGPIKTQSAVDLVRFSPDGRRLLTGIPEEEAVRIWDPDTGQAVTAPLKHPLNIQDAEFSPDGRYVATGCADGVARLWDTETGEVVSSGLRHGGPVLGVRFSPNGQLLITTSGDGTAKLWNLVEMGFFRRMLKPGTIVSHAEFSPDGRLLVTAGDDGIARVWDTGTGTQVGHPMQHDNEIPHAAFSHNGRWVVTASKDKTARVWDWKTGLLVSGPLTHDAPVISAGFSPDDRLVVTTSEDGTARVWNALDGKPIGAALRHTGAVRQAAINGDDQLVLTVSDDRTARLWETASSAPRTPPLGSGWALGDQTHVEFSPKGDQFLTVLEVAQVWDVATCKPVGPPLTLGSAQGYATFSPDGGRVATAGGEGIAEIWDAATGRALTAPMQHSQLVSRVAFDKNGGRLATASLDKTARLWDAATGEPLTPPMRHERRVADVAFSADGRWLLTLTEPGVPQLWDLSVSGSSLEQTKRLVELMANSRSVPGGQPNRLSREELRTAWQELKQREPRTEELSPEKVLRWHEREAAESELAWQWQAAIFHLSALIAAHPDVPSLKHRRAIAYDRAGQWENAVGDDPGIQRSIPLRDPKASDDLIDLSAYYNWPLTDFGEGLNNLAALPTGIQTFAGVQFDIRGVIHMTDPSDATPKDGKSISIRLERKCARLHFLHAALFGRPAVEGLQIGKYEIHYAGNGQTAQVPIIYGQQVLDWALQPGEPWASKELQVVWKGTNAVSTQNGGFIRLFKTTWENPNPDVEIGSLDLVPEGKMANGAVPFVVAITADNLGTQVVGSMSSPRPNKGLLPQIHPRDPKASEEQIDLSDYYTAGLFQDMLNREGHNLACLPNGLQVFGNVQFDVRGIVRLARAGQPTSRNPNGPWNEDDGYPDRVEGIQINRKATRLHFLQSALHSEAPNGTELGSYIVHFANGEQKEIPIIYGKDTHHWLGDPYHTAVWEGSQLVPDFGICKKYLFKQTWENPFPDVEIRSLDFVSAMTPTTAPFLVALTAETGWLPQLWFVPGLAEILAAQTQAYRPTAENWFAVGKSLEEENRNEEAVQAFTHAIQELSLEWLRQSALSHRARLIAKQGRFAEASADNIAAQHLPSRDPSASSHLLDLSPYFNRSLDSESPSSAVYLFGLPRGLHTLPGTGGTEFDLRGVVRVRGSSEDLMDPAAVTDIPMRQKCRRLYFLESAHFRENEDTLVGSYVIHYANGTTEEIAIRYGEHVRDWVLSVDPGEVKDAKVAWTGTHPSKGAIRIFEQTWENPRPAVEIQHLDFVSKLTKCAPFLIAITAE